jgi:hypothetical protein
MCRVKAPRSFRPRLLLLPLVFGMLCMPAFLHSTTTPARDAGIHAGAVCSNLEAVEPLRRRREKRPPGPTCASCRAPLLNAPLAHLERGAQSNAGDAPPAA